jgi:hypothetical protein
MTPPPTPSPPSKCVLPPAPEAGGGGVHTRRAVRGWGVNILDDARHWIGLLQCNPSTDGVLLAGWDNQQVGKWAVPRTVPAMHNPDGITLLKWTRRQRNVYHFILFLINAKLLPFCFDHIYSVTAKQAEDRK